MRYLSTSSAPVPMARYSQGVELAGGERLILCSGQLGITLDGHVPEDPGEQARLCLQHCEAILTEAGLNRHHVVKLNAYVTDRAHLGAYMVARDAFFAACPVPPASTLIIVSGFSRPEFKVEIEVMAVAAKEEIAG